MSVGRAGKGGLSTVCDAVGTCAQTETRVDILLNATLLNASRPAL